MAVACILHKERHLSYSVDNLGTHWDFNDSQNVLSISQDTLNALTLGDSNLDYGQLLEYPQQCEDRFMH